MSTSKSNRELLILANLLSFSEKVVNEKGYAILALNGPLSMLPAVIDWCSKDGSKYDKDQALARRDAVKFVPLGFVHMNPKIKYAYAVGVGYRALAAGWYPKNVPQPVDKFLQELYDAGENTSIVAGDAFVKSLMEYVPSMQKLGYFLPIVR